MLTEKVLIAASPDGQSLFRSPGPPAPLPDSLKFSTFFICSIHAAELARAPGLFGFISSEAHGWR
jgi:hypothetical protein